jgi:hypothetical protein
MSIGYVGIDGIFFVGFIVSCLHTLQRPAASCSSIFLDMSQFLGCLPQFLACCQNQVDSGVRRPFLQDCVVSHAFLEFGDFAMTCAEPRIPRAFAGAEIGDREN